MKNQQSYNEIIIKLRTNFVDDSVGHKQKWNVQLKFDPKLEVSAKILKSNLAEFDSL